MSNTNIGQQNQYDVDIAWPKEEPTDAEDCLKTLVRLSREREAIECHGVDQDYGCIRSSFDIHFFNKSNVPKKQPKDVEKDLLESFEREASPHFPPEARRFIEVARLKWDTLYNTGTVFVGRHYCLPTRCVDWTTNPLVALFFACRRCFQKPSVVWWMDYSDFSNAITGQWPLIYGKEKNIEEDFEKDFTEEKDRDVLTRFHYSCLLDRPNKQNAHIILSGQYDVHHDRAIRRLGVQKCGRIVIRSDMKFELLGKLNTWGINSAKLGIEHSYIDTIAVNIADKIFGQKL